ncbi:ATP cone domain-containing protein [Deinococcus lacus]|uniref:ATP cone domain-containing protein n=1 Tax=Deinococcus lacus TaxID=392561 RepID=A0ABW1YDH7_9DEIO
MAKQLVGTSKHHWPFSRGLVTASLMNAGASRKVAVAAARRVEQQLQSRDLNPVRPEDLKELMVEVARDVSRSLGKAVARQTPMFVDIVITTPRGKSPFSRGILARLLEDTGLSSRDAYDAAEEVDLRLHQRGVTSLSEEELHSQIEDALADRYGEHFRLTYRFLRRNRGRLGVLADGEGSEAAQMMPFSKGVLVQSLMAAGASPDTARTLARIVQRDLQAREDRVVSRAQIRERVSRLLPDEAGRYVAARYQLLRAVRHLPRPLLILVGGVSGTGKSHLASELAYRLGIPRIINTDTIREVMRAMIAPSLIPTLHTSTFNAWQTMVAPGEPIPERPRDAALLVGFREQVRQVSTGLDAVIGRTITERANVVVEGVHLVPGFLSQELLDRALVVQLLVVNLDEREHRQHFEHRERETASSRPLHRYMQHFREIRVMQDYLLGLAERANVPVLNDTAQDENVERAIDLVLQKVVSSLSEEERQALLGEEDLDLDDFLTEKELSRPRSAEAPETEAP